jgi:hypothetical protein
LHSNGSTRYNMFRTALFCHYAFRESTLRSSIAENINKGCYLFGLEFVAQLICCPRKYIGRIIKRSSSNSP